MTDNDHLLLLQLRSKLEATERQRDALLAAIKAFPGHSCGTATWYDWIDTLKQAVALVEREPS